MPRAHQRLASVLSTLPLGHKDPIVFSNLTVKSTQNQIINNIIDVLRHDLSHYFEPASSMHYDFYHDQIKFKLAHHNQILCENKKQYEFMNQCTKWTTRRFLDQPTVQLLSMRQETQNQEIRIVVRWILNGQPKFRWVTDEYEGVFTYIVQNNLITHHVFESIYPTPLFCMQKTKVGIV